MTHDLHIKIVAYIFAHTAAATVLTDGWGRSSDAAYMYTNGTTDLSADLGDDTRRLASRGRGDDDTSSAQEEGLLASRRAGMGEYTRSHLALVQWQLALSLFCALSVLIRSLLWPFQVRMHVCMHVCMRACMYACMCVCSAGPACMHACMHACMYVCMSICSAGPYQSLTWPLQRYGVFALVVSHMLQRDVSTFMVIFVLFGVGYGVPLLVIYRPAMEFAPGFKNKLDGGISLAKFAFMGDTFSIDTDAFEQLGDTEKVSLSISLMLYVHKRMPACLPACMRISACMHACMHACAQVNLSIFLMLYILSYLILSYLRSTFPSS